MKPFCSAEEFTWWAFQTCDNQPPPGLLRCCGFLKLVEGHLCFCEFHPCVRPIEIRTIRRLCEN